MSSPLTTPSHHHLSLELLQQPSNHTRLLSLAPSMSMQSSLMCNSVPVTHQHKPSSGSCLPQNKIQILPQDHRALCDLLPSPTHNLSDLSPNQPSVHMLPPPSSRLPSSDFSASALAFPSAGHTLLWEILVTSFLTSFRSLLECHLLRGLLKTKMGFNFSPLCSFPYPTPCTAMIIAQCLFIVQIPLLLNILYRNRNSLFCDCLTPVSRKRQAHSRHTINIKVNKTVSWNNGHTAF